MNLYLAGATNRQLEEALHACGIQTTLCSLDDIAALASQPVLHPHVVLLDLRGRTSVPPSVAILTRQHPTAGVVVVASHLDPALMLEAMRAGVTEFVSEPITQSELRAAIDRVATKRPASEPGQVFAFVGGKGGIGTTTLAVNVAAALAKRAPSSTLFVDLHVSSGDAALFVGIEPRFSVADALENVHRLDESFLRSLAGRTKFGLDLLASSERTLVGALEARTVRSLIDCAARHYRYVVLDVPRSDSTMLEALELVNTIVIVANQELATVRSASRVAALLRQRYGKDRVTVVVSRFDQHAEIGRKEFERVMAGPVAQVFPSNYRLALTALNVGRPLVLDNHNKLAGSFESFAAGLASPDAPVALAENGTTRSGLLGRLGLRS